MIPTYHNTESLPMDDEIESKPYRKPRGGSAAAGKRAREEFTRQVNEYWREVHLEAFQEKYQADLDSPREPGRKVLRRLRRELV